MKPTLYNLLQQHGATSDFNKIAALIGDNEAIIVNSIQVPRFLIGPRTSRVLIG